MLHNSLARTIDLNKFQVSTKRNQEIISGSLIDATKEAERAGLDATHTAIEARLMNKILMDMNPANREVLSGEIIPGICKRFYTLAVSQQLDQKAEVWNFDFYDHDIKACLETGDYNEYVLTFRAP